MHSFRARRHRSGGRTATTRKNDPEAGSGQPTRSFVGGRPAVSPDDQLDDGQPDARTWHVRIETVGPSFELLPDCQFILARDTRAIVVNLKHEVVVNGGCRHEDMAAPISDRVGDEVVEHLTNAVGIEICVKLGLDAYIETHG